MTDYRQIEVKPDGRLWDHSAMAAYEAEIERRARASRVHVERLSRRDPEIAAFEAEDRGVRAERAA